jgi:hypothetical protein
VDETFRMLGREHQADLEREAQKRQLAALAGTAPIAPGTALPLRERRRLLFLLRLAQNNR